MTIKTLSRTPLVGVFLGLMGVASVTHAGMILERSSPVAGEAAQAFPHRMQLDLNSIVTPNITQSGVTPIDLPLVRGAARGVSVTEAMRQLLPLGWKLFVDGELDTTRRTDWTGNRSWVLILSSVLVDVGLNAHLDWPSRELTLLPAPLLVVTPRARPKKAPSEVLRQESIGATESLLSDAEVRALVASVMEARNNRKAAPIEAPRPVPVVAPVDSPKPAVALVPQTTAPRLVATKKVWQLTADKSLRENFEALAKQEGWRIVWSARKGEQIYDYPAAPLAGQPFEGELMGETGVLARIITFFGKSEVPLSIHFYNRNKVAEVRLYKPASAPALEASALAANPATK